MTRWDHAAAGEIVLLDNRDSFVFNLLHRLHEAGGRELVVVRSDQISVSELQSWRPGALVVSPGPGHPDDAGVSVAAIRAFSGKIPILGVCLGHQAIVTAFGGVVSQGDCPLHGKSSWVAHDGKRLFQGLDNPIQCGRYHSLSATTLPDALDPTAWVDDIIMGVRHREHPTLGVQFHPESVLTPAGGAMLERFLGLVDSV